MKRITLLMGACAALSCAFGSLGAEISDTFSEGYETYDDGCYSCDDGCYYWVGGDLLYWTVNESELDYAVDNEIGEVGNLGRGKVHYLDHDWNVGFRLFAGCQTDWDCWAAVLSYTYYSDEAKDSSRTKNSQSLVPTLEPPDAQVEVVDAAKGVLNFDYQVLDLMLIRPFCQSGCSGLYAFFGARALWLDQDLRVRYNGGTIEDEEFLFDSIRNHGEYDCAGLHFGFRYSLNSCNGFGLYAVAGSSILAGRTDDRQKITRFSDSEGIQVDIDIKDRQHTSLFGYNLGLGAHYITAWDCSMLGLSVGYEMNEWINVPRLRRWVDGGHRGSNEGVARGATTSATDRNLLLHGLTVRGTYCF